MLEKLSQVQSFDLDLDALQAKKRLTPPELIEVQQRKRELEATLAAVQENHDTLGQQVRANEGEIDDLAARRKAAANAASAATSSKEASQYQNQELQLAARLEELETETLPLIERLETLEARIAELNGELAALEPQLQEMLSDEARRVAEIDAESAVIMGNRDAIAREIDASLLKQYEQVRRSRRGLGLVPIIDNRRCGGCNMQLPIHVMQKASQGQGIVRCPSCGRILWSKETP